MKAENVDALVRDLIEAIGVPNRKGVPLHLLIAEAKAFAKQNAEDTARYIESLEPDHKAAEAQAAEVKRLKDEVSIAHDAAHLFQQQLNDLRDRVGLSYLDDYEKLGIDEIRELFHEVDELKKNFKDAVEVGKVLDAVGMHDRMVNRAEIDALSGLVSYWKGVAADFASGHALSERLYTTSDGKYGLASTLRRRLDTLPKGHPEHEKLSKILSNFVSPTSEED